MLSWRNGAFAHSPWCRLPSQTANGNWSDPDLCTYNTFNFKTLSSPQLSFTLPVLHRPLIYSPFPSPSQLPLGSHSPLRLPILHPTSPSPTSYSPSLSFTLPLISPSTHLSAVNSKMMTPRDYARASMKYYTDMRSQRKMPEHVKRARLVREDSEYNTSAFVSYNVEDFRFNCSSPMVWLYHTKKYMHSINIFNKSWIII